ncbi:hypothetical protein PV419_19765 [Streptomyces sp. ME19-01-6]|nr:hypothetical protein [Streptomyces sp. ME19-01-6]
MANVPLWAATLLTVGAGPRSYGLPLADADCADAGWIETSAAIRPVTAATTAALSLTIVFLEQGLAWLVEMPSGAGTSVIFECIVWFLLAFAVSTEVRAVHRS